MAKGAVGGKRRTNNPTFNRSIGGSISVNSNNTGVQNAPSGQNTNSNANANPAPTQSSSGTNTGGLANFRKMSNAQKAQTITNAINKGVPMHLADNSMQRFLYNIGADEKPSVVSTSQFNSESGSLLVRAVNRVRDSARGVTYSPTEIAKQIMFGRHTRVSDLGGSVHGHGIYFDTGSSYYGNTYGNIKKTGFIHAKYSKNARIITERNADAGVRREMSSGSPLGKALSKCDYNSRSAIWALANGYDAMTVSGSGSNPSGYQVVLNRGALIIDSNVYDR